MLDSIWIYEIILFIYGLSLVAYIADFIKSNWIVKRIAIYLLALAWVVQTIVILYEVLYLKNFPIWTLNDGIYVYAWVLLTFSLVMNQLFPVHFMVFFTNIFTFFMLWFAISLHARTVTSVTGGIRLDHEILITHITFSIIAYGFLTLSFLLATMYLLQYKLLKRKKGFKWLWRFTNLKQLDTYSFAAAKIGVPFLFIGLLLGVIWGYTSDAEFYWWDSKTLGSIMLLMIYVGYLILRWKQLYRGKSISLYNSATFLILLMNFFLFNVFSNFHLG